MKEKAPEPSYGELLSGMGGTDLKEEGRRPSRGTSCSLGTFGLLFPGWARIFAASMYVQHVYQGLSVRTYISASIVCAMNIDERERERKRGLQLPLLLATKSSRGYRVRPPL